MLVYNLVCICDRVWANNKVKLHELARREHNKIKMQSIDLFITISKNKNSFIHMLYANDTSLN